MNERERSGGPTQYVAVGLAALAALLWATSFIYIKVGLEDIPPLTFASLRYLIGAGALLLFRLNRPPAPQRRRLERSEAWLLVGLGIALYAIVPGVMFVGLDKTEAIAFNFVFQAGIPLMLAFTAGFVLKEPTSWWEWAGVAVVVLGIWRFFVGGDSSGGDVVGVLLAATAAVSIGGSNLIQRRLMRTHVLSSLDATMVPMALGSILLLIVALVVEDFPALDRDAVVLLLVLGVVNTAFAFTIWHHAMETLNALHAGVIASAQLVEVAILAWWFLGESLTMERIIGSFIVLAGILIVHFSKARAARRLAYLAAFDEWLVTGGPSPDRSPGAAPAP